MIPRLTTATTASTWIFPAATTSPRTTPSNINEGIRLQSSSNNNVTGNNASDNFEGILLLSSSNNNNVTGNTANSNDQDGIQLDSSSNNTIKGNNASYNQAGIYMWSSSNNNTITGNNASSNDLGIYLYRANNSSITVNKASYNSDDGITLSFSYNNTFTGNTANSNRHGIYMWSSDNNTFTRNTVNSNNDYGIYLRSSTNNNSIYDNYFNNTNNAYDIGDNIWNITKTAGVNILGGPYLGGNYWNDYAGSDTDGDWLGNTLLPYTSAGNIGTGGDYHPLIFPPIENLDTGETFYTIQAAIDDADTDDGDTIKVPPGTYKENVVIDKEVLIVGDPVLDGMNGIGFSVEANNTHIENFTITNCSTGVYVYNASFMVQNFTLSNCTISNCSSGGIEFENVTLSKVNDIAIEDILNSTENAVALSLQNAHNNNFTGITIGNITGTDAYGIHLNYSDNNNFSASTTISKLNATGVDGWAYGIYLMHSHNTSFHSTAISYLNATGVDSKAFGTKLWHSNNTSFHSNITMLRFNAAYGAFGIGLEHSHNTNFNSNITMFHLNATSRSWGITLFNSNNSTQLVLMARSSASIWVLHITPASTQISPSPTSTQPVMP